MSWAQILLLALLQGLTEFLPVSSSGHLVLAQEWLRVRQAGLAVELLLHAGSLLAVVLYFRRDLLQILRGSTRAFASGGGAPADREARHLAALLALATLPVVAAGLLLGDRIAASFESPRLVCGMLAVTGLLLLSTRLVSVRDRPLGPARALGVGLFQAGALLPGISRSGSTIAGGLLVGLGPVAAARFAFLLSVPAILGACVLRTKDLSQGLSGPEAGKMLAGFAVSFATSWLAIDVLLRVVRRGKLAWFGVYCLLAAATGFLFL